MFAINMSLWATTKKPRKRERARLEERGGWRDGAALLRVRGGEVLVGVQEGLGIEGIRDLFCQFLTAAGLGGGDVHQGGRAVGELVGEPQG